MDLSMFIGFALALHSNPTSRLFVTGCLFLGATAALAVFGYSWNDVSDADADSRAGKTRPAPRQSRLLALGALGLASALFMAAARLGAVLLALAFAAIILAWAYSGRPLRLKERGALGLIAGGIAQRAVPAVFVAVAFDVSVRHAVPWLVWMTCWGLRAMVVHQAQDAESDRLAGLTTWGAQRRVRQKSHRLVAALVPLELASFVTAVTPVFAHGSVRVAGAIALAGWLLLTAATVRCFHARAVRVDWLSFRYMPFADLYCVFTPVLVATALGRSGMWVAWAWIAVDTTLRVPALRKSWRRFVGLYPSALTRSAKEWRGVRGASNG